MTILPRLLLKHVQRSVIPLIQAEVAPHDHPPLIFTPAQKQADLTDARSLTAATSQAALQQNYSQLLLIKNDRQCTRLLLKEKTGNPRT